MADVPGTSTFFQSFIIFCPFLRRESFAGAFCAVVGAYGAPLPGPSHAIRYGIPDSLVPDTNVARSRFAITDFCINTYRFYCCVRKTCDYQNQNALDPWGLPAENRLVAVMLP